MQKLNPLEIYLNRLEYILIEKSDKRKKYQNYRLDDYKIILDRLEPKKILEYKNLMFNINVSHRNHKFLQNWIDVIHYKIKQGFIPRKEIVNYKRYIAGEVKKIIRYHIESICDEENIGYYPQHKFVFNYYRDNIEQLKKIIKEICIDLILYN